MWWRSIVLFLALCAVLSAQKPNFIVIFADDLGYGDLASYGHPTIQTPHLDRMAAEGVRFTEFYVPMPFCAPSRATLLTGRYPFRNGMVRNPTPDRGVNKLALPASEITIAAALREQGYATTAIGKWHLGHTPGNLPTDRGFDSYLGILYSNDMFPVQLVEDDQVVEYPVAQATLTKRYTKRALEFIETNKDQPFFLYLPHAMPHKPLAASEDFYTPATPQDLYADVIRELDWSVGQVLAKVKALGLDERTLVLFTSDNGPFYGGYTAGLRGMKGRSWDGGIKVPFIARWPGRVRAGAVSEELCASIDIFPTLLGLAGVKVPDDRVIDGLDIMPLFESGDAKSPHEAIYAMRGTNLAIIRSGRWKLHVHNPGSSQMMRANWVDPRAPDGVTILAPYEQATPHQYPGVMTGDAPAEMMLFDLHADPAEQHNVAAANPEVVRRMKAMFDEVNKTASELPPAADTPYPEIRRVKGGALRYDEFLP
jgi:N-acetylgalactosamine-6-sulfatase